MTYPSAGAQFGVGYSGGGSSTYDAPYTADTDPSGDAPWYTVVANVGMAVFDQLTYTQQERARDGYTAANEQAAIDAQVQLGTIAQQTAADNQRLTMIVVGGVGAAVALALVLK